MSAPARPYLLSLRSDNGKTGPIAVSSVAAQSCPASCPLGQDGTCYAMHGPISWTWRRLSEGRIASALSYDALRAALRSLPAGALYRHGQQGDWFGPDEIRGIQAATAHLTAWGYTHHRDPEVWRAMRTLGEGGLVINASADGLPEAHYLASLGLPTVVTLPQEAPKVTRASQSQRVIVCWAQQAEGRTCADCRGARGIPWCADARRDFIVGFRAHGVKKAALNRRLNVLREHGPAASV